MDREAWWGTVHGVTRVEHDLETKPPTFRLHFFCFIYFYTFGLSANLDA